MQLYLIEPLNEISELVAHTHALPLLKYFWEDQLHLILWSFLWLRELSLQQEFKIWKIGDW